MSDLRKLKANPHWGSERTELDMDEIREAAGTGRKIPLIKIYRELAGCGLKDAKDAVELAANSGCVGNHSWNMKGIVAAFEQFTINGPSPYTKEEFLHLIEDAIDHMDKFQFVDMADCVALLLKNVEKNGGLERLAKERDNFLDNI